MEHHGAPVLAFLREDLGLGAGDVRRLVTRFPAVLGMNVKVGRTWGASWCVLTVTSRWRAAYHATHRHQEGDRRGRARATEGAVHEKGARGYGGPSTGCVLSAAWPCGPASFVPA